MTNTPTNAESPDQSRTPDPVIEQCVGWCLGILRAMEPDQQAHGEAETETALDRNPKDR